MESSRRFLDLTLDGGATVVGIGFLVKEAKKANDQDECPPKKKCNPSQKNVPKGNLIVFHIISVNVSLQIEYKCHISPD